MRELIRTSDVVVLTAAEAQLRSAGLGCVMLDEHAGAMYGGVIARRLMVDEEEYRLAANVLRDAGLGDHLYEPD